MKKEPKKPIRRCTRCRGIGHRADGQSCPMAHPPELTGAAALKAFVLEDIAVTIIVSGQAQETLLSALRSMDARNGGASIVNAYRTLAERALQVSGDTIERARKAKALLDAAQTEYAEAIAPIRKVIKAP